MSIIYEEKKDEGLLAGYPVRKTFFKKDEVLHFDKINKQWIAKVINVGVGEVEEAPIDGNEYARKNATWVTIITAGGGSVLLATTYDRTATTGLLFCSQYDPTA